MRCKYNSSNINNGDNRGSHLFPPVTSQYHRCEPGGKRKVNYLHRIHVEELHVVMRDSKKQ